VAVLIDRQGWNIWLAIVVTLFVAALVGVVNGFIVVKLRLSSFIATLGMATVLSAVQTIITGPNQPLPPTSRTWLNLTQYQVFGFQIVVVYMIILGALLWWMLEFTPMGRYLYAVGGNSEAARLSGIETGFWTWTALTVSSTICGIGGVLYASQIGPALTFGSAMLLPAFAAVFLGSTQITPGRFNILGSFIAVFVLATGIKGLQLVTSAQWLSDMFNGLALIVAVAFAIWRQRRKAEGTQDDEQPVMPNPDSADRTLAEQPAASV
jgi:ribose transport system permease protein